MGLHGFIQKKLSNNSFNPPSLSALIDQVGIVISLNFSVTGNPAR
jgi:hypothetical protein